MGHLADRSSRGRGDEHGVGPEPEVYVAVPRAIAPRKELADDGPPAERGQREGRDKLLGGGRHDYLHLGPLPDECAGEVCRFVSSYAARHAEDDLPAHQASEGLFSLHLFLVYG